jgi:UDP-N-acetylmuramoyl-L-alanine---L-glutamate ligase
MINKIIDELKNKKILILGMGKEGISTYKFLSKYILKDNITLADSNIIEIIKEQKIDNINIINNLDFIELLKEYDVVFKSPGISFKDIDIKEYESKINSQMNIFLKHSDCITVGITGTKGKSTTSSLLYSVINNEIKNVFLVGNIGVPIFDRIEEFDDESIVILEMSSHQLEFINYTPNISVILNIYPEHLDHYRSYDDYVKAKLNIVRSNKTKHVIINEDLKNMIDFKNKIIVKNNIDKDNIYGYNFNDNRKLIGDHNKFDILVVLEILNLLSLNLKNVNYSINNFNPLEHRLEYVGEYKEIKFYNDSISTIPQTTINCIKSIKDLSILILGGYDRGIDYSELIDYINNNNNDLEYIYCIPDTGIQIGNKINKSTIKLEYVDNLEQVIKEIFKLNLKNKICALSPASASYNQFKNFEERGKKYKEYIVKYSKENS